MLTVVIERYIESLKEVIDTCQGPRTSNGVVREDISEDRVFGMERDRGPHEVPDERGKWTFCEELLGGVKE